MILYTINVHICVLFTISLNLSKYLIYICYILNYVIKDNAGRYGPFK
ncbi:unnamed protein product [Callosobruchus maculatus]|uniref:Uncharacterized protein n=1 Tax=Callosobruchus maculatus TaxID=64391 RepID=A0A653BVK5_CALMS|nr:unnamed protein product [Callosobruchus maculatus]